ncbi:MAG: hypothetical protein Q8941_22260 [Bacteroidota bacterium]|nr:hypothetical protein [Bacteroidota bacterium]
MKLLFYFPFILIIISCKNISRKHAVTIRKDDAIIKGDIINDTIFNDTILYFDLNNNLTRKSFFKNGKQEGISTDFYPSGNPMIETFYSDGLKNGYNLYYDSLGKCFYKDYYYYNLTVGPITYFNRDGTPKTFFFANLQNETLLHINYNDWHGIKEIVAKCINFIANSQNEDSTQNISLLLYLINPPKLSFEYSILKKERKSEDNFKTIRLINNDTEIPFVNIILPNLTESENYSIGLTVYDSILNKKTVIYKDL